MIKIGDTVRSTLNNSLVGQVVGITSLSIDRTTHPEMHYVVKLFTPRPASFTVDKDYPFEGGAGRPWLVSVMVWNVKHTELVDAIDR